MKKSKTKKEEKWEIKTTMKCPYCKEIIGGMGGRYKCGCGKTELAGLSNNIGFIFGGEEF